MTHWLPLILAATLSHQEVIMPKWNIKYVVKNTNGETIEKHTEVFGKTAFEAYANAGKILKIIERKSTIIRYEIVYHDE